MKASEIIRSVFVTERIKRLTQLTLDGKMFPYPTPTEYDLDCFLPEMERQVGCTCQYIENQSPVINEYSALPGLLSFDDTCVGDAFNMCGHDHAGNAMGQFYEKVIDNLTSICWQHATGDYFKVLNKGIAGIVKEIEKSLACHTREEAIAFLTGMKKVCASIVKWAHKCGAVAAELASTTRNIQYKRNLEHLAKALSSVPEKPAESFYEALVCMTVCYSFNPDSFGTLDRYLEPFYNRDTESGILTRDEAKELLQEFLLVPQARNTPGVHWTKGGQSHFCIGGYDIRGEDGFTELSRLIVESLMELPTYIPEITFRWTPKTTHEDFYYVMDCERKDKNKRIAFTNDARRIQCLTEICGIPYEKAICYTLVGCNELAFPGSIAASTSKGNVLRCIDTLFHKKSAQTETAETFEVFYRLFEAELYRDLDAIYEFDDKLNLRRAKDVSFVSSIFFNDCIENAKSLTQGGGNTAVAAPMLIGMVNVIDSITVVKQFVYDEKRISMGELIAALQANWQGYEDLHSLIEKKADYFGNDLERSNEVARMVYHSIYLYLKGKRTVFGYPIIMGDHTGYPNYFVWFGAGTRATPDGRYSAEPVKFGLFQRKYDRNSLTAHLNSIAGADPDGISCGNTVSNITVEQAVVQDDDRFEKLVTTMETYFKQGGIQFQLNYTSPEDLKNAQKKPDDYRNLRVRVTGFSEYFVKLEEEVQNDIISRTATG